MVFLSNVRPKARDSRTCTVRILCLFQLQALQPTCPTAPTLQSKHETSSQSSTSRPFKITTRSTHASQSSKPSRHHRRNPRASVVLHRAVPAANPAHARATIGSPRPPAATPSRDGRPPARPRLMSRRRARQSKRPGHWLVFVRESRVVGAFQTGRRGRPYIVSAV